MTPLTLHNPELARLPGDGPDYGNNPPHSKLSRMRYREWLARRSAELRGHEPEPVTSEGTFDGRPELLHCRHGLPASKQHLCEKCMAEAAGYGP